MYITYKIQNFHQAVFRDIAVVYEVRMMIHALKMERSLGHKGIKCVNLNVTFQCHSRSNLVVRIKVQLDSSDMCSKVIYARSSLYSKHAEGLGYDMSNLECDLPITQGQIKYT